MTCPRWRHPSPARSKTAPKTEGQDSPDEYEAIYLNAGTGNPWTGHKRVAMEPNIALGFVDFTSNAVNFGFELDNGSTFNQKYKQANTESFDRMKSMIPRARFMTRDLLEDWDGIRLSRTLQCQTLGFHDLERTAFIDSGELGLCETDRFYTNQKLLIKCEVSMHLIDIMHILYY